MPQFLCPTACVRDAWRWGGRGQGLGAEKLGARKMLEMPHRTHKYTARFIGQVSQDGFEFELHPVANRRTAKHFDLIDLYSSRYSSFHKHSNIPLE